MVVIFVRGEEKVFSWFVLDLPLLEEFVCSLLFYIPLLPEPPP